MKIIKMSNQLFDYYKNRDVEYDFILSAIVNIGKTSEEVLPEIISFIKDEDLLAMYFDKIALGRVYPKVEYLNNKLHFTFGISLVDAIEIPTSKELIENINNFILSLNKNIKDKDIKIKEGDIKVEVITENKNNFDNIDKILVSENNLYFSRGNDTQRFKLTDDGIVEKYLNENLQETFPFSKLGLSRECKTLVTEGYTLTMKLNEANITDTTATGSNKEDALDLSDPEKTKQNLQQNIKDVEEIQDLKDELDDKMANIMEESIKPDEKFPSSEFTSETLKYQDINVKTFEENLTPEQKTYINMYIGDIAEMVAAMKSLYDDLKVKSLISIDEYIEEVINYDDVIFDALFDSEKQEERFLGPSDSVIADSIEKGLYTEIKSEINKDEELSYEDLEDLARDIYDWYGSDMGTYFDEIRGNEESVYGDIMTVLETKDQAQIQNFIDTIKEADIDDETAKQIKIATTSSLLDRLNKLLNNAEIKTENKSKFHTADKMFDDFLKTAKEEAGEDGYIFKLSDLGLTKEDSVDFKNLLLQRDEIEDVSYDPQNNTYTVKVTGAKNVENPDDNDSDEK